MRRVLAIAMVLGGCGGLKGLTSDESALVSDNDDASDTEDGVETGIEEGLSGSAPDDPSTAPDPATPMTTLADSLRANAPRFFTPAGCLTIVVSGNTATATFDHCTGPWRKHTYDGVVVTTWTASPGKLVVTHHAAGFRLDGATLDHDATIESTRSGDLVTRHRSGTTVGKTRLGRAIDRSFDFTAVWDGAARCISRDGVASTTVGARSFDATVTGYRRCGVGSLGCPESGTITLSASGPLRTLTLSIEFPGGREVNITRPNGEEVTRELVCNP